MANGSFGLSGFPTASPTVGAGTEISLVSQISYYEQTSIYTVPAGKSARVISITPSRPDNQVYSYTVLLKRGADTNVVYGPSTVSGYTAGTYYPGRLNINPVEGDGLILESGDELLAETVTNATWYRDRNTNINIYDYQLYNPYYLNSLWLIPAYKYTTNQSVLLYSSDGNTWSESVIGTASQRLVFATYGNGYYAVCALNASSNAFFYTTNLAGPWTSVNIAGASNINAFSYAANRFVLATGSTLSNYYVSTTSAPTSFTAILKPLPYNAVSPTTTTFFDVIDVDSTAVIASSCGLISTSNFTSWNSHGVALAGSRGNGTWALASQSNGFHNSLAINPTNGNYFLPTALDPTDNNAALLQTSVVKSTDGGVNWSLVALPTTYSSSGSHQPVYYINRTTNSNHFYIPSFYASNGQRPIYYSTDSGSTWSVILKTGLNATVFQNGAQTKFSPLIGNNNIFIASINVAGTTAAICQLASGTINQVNTVTYPAGVSPGASYGVPAFYSPTTGKYWLLGNNATVVSYSQSNDGITWGAFTTCTSAAGNLQGACQRPGSQGFIVGTTSAVHVFTTDTATSPTYTHTLGNVIGMTVSGDTTSSEIVVITTDNKSHVSTDGGVTFASTVANAAINSTNTIGSGNFLFCAYDTFRSKHVYTTGSTSGQTFYSSNGFYWDSAVITYTAGSTNQTVKLSKTTDYVYIFAQEGSRSDRISRSGTFANNMGYGTAIQYPSALKPSTTIQGSIRGINIIFDLDDRVYYASGTTNLIKYYPSPSASVVNSQITLGTTSLTTPTIPTTNVTAWAFATDGNKVLLVGVNATNSMSPGEGGASYAAPLSSVALTGTLITSIIEQEA